jgi:adenosylcobinamide-GDP ribazoletransferase
MLVFLPVVGLVIGLIWYGLYLLAQKADMPLSLQAAALMLYPYLITGFIHLDGFMDTSDALLSRRTLEEKLRILKDPHTGAFAVISVAVLFIICYAAVTAVVEKVSTDNAQSAAPEGAMLVLIFIPVVTRCCSSITVLAGKPLAHSQYKTEEGVKKPAAEIAAMVSWEWRLFSPP